MYEQVEKPKENKSRAVANSVGQKKSNQKQGFGFSDNRPEAVTQRKLQEVTNSNPQAKPLVKNTIQKPRTSQPIQRVGLLRVLGGISMATLLAMMKYDSYVREENYTKKIKNIPGVSSEIFAQAEKAKQEGQEVDPNLHKIVAEGAIEARNRQMEDTREKITPLGLMLSVFMKKEGLGMRQLKKKYKERFPDKSDEEIFKLIIDSAGRSNPSLASKFLKSLPISKL